MPGGNHSNNLSQNDIICKVRWDPYVQPIVISHRLGTIMGGMCVLARIC